MKKILFASLLGAAVAAGVSGAAWAAEGVELPHQTWTFDGVRGHYDKAEILRGYDVFTNVCMACHSLKYISPREMMQAGFTEAEVKTMADTLGKKLDDRLLTGMDEASAQESFGKVPPDLSLITRARHGGADYVYAVLTGYSEDPQLQKELLPNGIPQGAYFNTAFAGHAIAMPQPLTGPDMVTYADGTSATVPQMAHDVVTFLQWASEPEKVERQHMGVYVLLYVLLFTLLAYLTKRAIWRDVKKH